MSDATPTPTSQAASSPAAAAVPAANGGAPSVQSSSAPAAPVAKVEPQSLLSLDGATSNTGEEGKIGEPGQTGPEPTAIEYKWTLPDTISADDEGLKAFELLARESKLAPEMAQKILDFDIQRQAAAMERYQSELAEQNKARVAALQSDKEFGGAKFQETVSHANNALKALGDAELLADIKAAGMGDHPGFIKLLAKVGKAMAEDRSLRGGGEPTRHQRPADILYGNN